MTTPRDPDALLVAYLADGMEVLPDRVVDAVLDEVHRTRQRAVFGPWRTRSMFKPALGAAAVFAVLVLGGTFVMIQRSQPAVVGGPSQNPIASPSEVAPSEMPSPVATPRAAAVIAYIKPTGPATFMGGQTSRVWIVGADGSGAHELFPGGTADQRDVAWSPDGSRLIYTEAGRLYLTDASGRTPQVVDPDCVPPACWDSSAAFSPDGTQLVFLRVHGVTAVSWPIATMDLASGRVVELSSTATVGPDRPRWSPDGRQIDFSSFDKFGDLINNSGNRSAVFIVDADGKNLRQLSSATLPARLPDWSPDGSRIVFTSYVTKIVRVAGDNVLQTTQDVYTVRPDWTDLRRLTTDGNSIVASWTPDGRIMFTRGCIGPTALSDAADCSAAGLWTMDADGSNAQLFLPGVTGQAAWQPTP